MLEDGSCSPVIDDLSQDTSRSSRRICCHDSKRIIPWTLFSSFITLTVVLLVLFLVFKDYHYAVEDNDSDQSDSQQTDATANNVSASLCGLRRDVAHPGIDLRVSGGRATSIEAWPWMTSLRDERGKHFCGATLIGDAWLLTAAHCLSEELSPPLATIVLGDTSLSDPSEYHEVRESFEVHPHPDFDASTFVHDVALVRFDPPVSATKGVTTACLNEGTAELDDFTKCFVTGWGATSFSDITSDILQEGRVPLVPTKNCSDRYGDRHQVTTQMICAVSSDWEIDTCKGDSGGPLTCENIASGTWSVIGVTSFGYGCWNPGNPAPGVYTRISSYLSDFIKPTVMGEERRR